MVDITVKNQRKQENQGQGMDKKSIKVDIACDLTHTTLIDAVNCFGKNFGMPEKLFVSVDIYSIFEALDIRDMWRDCCKSYPLIHSDRYYPQLEFTTQREDGFKVWQFIDGEICEIYSPGA